MAEDVKIYTLKHPITVVGDGGSVTTVEELRIGRMKAKHLKLLPPLTEEGKTISNTEMFPLIASMTNLSMEIIEEMDMEDMLAVTEGLGSFLGVNRSPQTGEKPSI